MILFAMRAVNMLLPFILGNRPIRREGDVNLWMDKDWIIIIDIHN